MVFFLQRLLRVDVSIARYKNIGDLFLNFHYNISGVIKLKKKCFLKIFPKPIFQS